jgi:hypothetical protein
MATPRKTAQHFQRQPARVYRRHSMRTVDKLRVVHPTRRQKLPANPTTLWRTLCFDPDIPITSCFKKQKKIHKKLEKSLKPSPPAPIQETNAK